MTLFADLEKLVSEEIDRHYGERTRILRRRKGEFFSGTADPDAEDVQEVIGIVDFNPTIPVIQDRGKVDGGIPMLSGNRVDVSYDKTLFARIADLPRQDDVIVLLDRSGEKYRVARKPEDDGIGRIVCVCAPTQ